MAEKRMFSQKIIDSDAFIDMPLSTQAVYFHLSMRADDEGFINNPKKILRMIGASEDEMKLLIAKRFVLDMETGVVVIKHWHVHNHIRKDRLKPTAHTKEKELLTHQENGSYTERQPNDNQMTTECQHSIEEISLDKSRLDKNKSSFDIFIDDLNKSFEENKISTFKSKINKTKSTKDVFGRFEVIEGLVLGFVEYVKRNRNMSARLDKFLIASLECNLNDIEYVKKDVKKDKTQDIVNDYFNSKDKDVIDAELD